MILSTHAIIGGATAATLTENPLLGFIIGIASHFVADAIPHWHYQTNNLHESLPSKKNFFEKILSSKNIKEIGKVGMECIVGLILILAAAHLSKSSIPVVFWGSIGGVFPDFLQLLFYAVYSGFPLDKIQAFHKRIHSKINLDNFPLVGIPSQLAIAIFFIWLIIK